MTVIEASSVRISTLADGTLRIVADIEPRNAQDAFALFAAPGTPMALAALRTGAEPVPEAPKGGPLSEWVARRCKEPAFRVWFCNAGPSGTDAGEEWVADAIRQLCGVKSRAAIDHDESAAAKLRRRVIEPWQKHCASTAASGNAPERSVG